MFLLGLSLRLYNGFRHFAPVATECGKGNPRPALLKALDEVGYETPTPIQAQAVPHLLNGLDLLGHAPTGTGKTGAFALPLISRLDLSNNSVQILTLTPTRELAAQIADSFTTYGKHLNLWHTVIFGGVSDKPESPAAVANVAIPSAVALKGMLAYSTGAPSP